MGLAINPHNGDLFIGDDPTFAILVNPPLAKGHVFTIKADATGAVPAECVGTAAVPCVQPAAAERRDPGALRVRPDGAQGRRHVHAGREDEPRRLAGGHLWAADHSQGLCRMDIVKDLTGTTLGLQRVQLAALRRRLAARLGRSDGTSTPTPCPALRTCTTCTWRRTTT